MMLRRFAKIALAALLSVSVPANAQGPSVKFRVLLFPNAQNVPPDGTAHSGMLAYPDPVGGKANAHLSVAPSATGIEAGASFALASGALPDGLDLDAGTGVISGFPAMAGLYSGITVTATDSSGVTTSGSFSFSIVEAALSYPAANTATVGVPFSVAPVPQNLDSPFYVRTSGSFPQGIDVDPVTGVVSGTPETAGTFAGIVVYGAGSDGASAVSNGFSITVAPSLPSATASMPSPLSGRVGEYFSAYASTNLSSPVWTVSSGTLPQGLGLDSATGEIRGNPLSPASLPNLRLTATQGALSAQTNPFSIDIAPAPSSNLAVAYPASTTVIRNLDGQSVPASVSGASGSVSFLRSNGSLPAGMSLDAGTGLISGTPTAAAATYANIRVRATDSVKSADSAYFSIVVANAVATSPGNQSGFTGSPFASAAPTTNLPSPVWSLASGTLAGRGLSLDPATGIISGTPTATGTYSGISLRADSGNVSATTAAFSIVVGGTPLPGASAFQQGKLGSHPFNPGGLTGTQTWTLVSGVLPDGLSLSPSTGVLSGTPTGFGPQPAFVVRVTTTGGQVVTSPDVVVNIVPIMTPVAISGWTVGLWKGDKWLTSNVADDPTRWRYKVDPTGGPLPTGIVMNQYYPQASTVPEEAGTYPGIRVIMVDLKDNNREYVSPDFSLTILPAPGAPIAFSYPPQRTFVIGSDYDVPTIGVGAPTKVIPYMTDPANLFESTRSMVVQQVGGLYLPWCQATGCFGRENGENGRIIFRMINGAQTTPGTYYMPPILIADTNPSRKTGEAPTTYRAGFWGDFTVKIFNSVTAPVAGPKFYTTQDGASSAPPAGNANIPVGGVIDMVYDQPVTAGSFQVGCDPSRFAGPFTIKVDAFLPDGTLYPMTEGLTVGSCASTGAMFYNTYGVLWQVVSQRFRVTVTAGTWPWLSNSKVWTAPR